MDSVRLELISLQYSKDSQTLFQLLEITTGRTISKRRKSEAVEILCRFYDDPDSPKKLYASLNEYEKEVIASIVNNGYAPLYEELAEIAANHGFKPKPDSYGYKNAYFPKNSKLYGFFIGDSYIPPLFIDYLEATVPKRQAVFKACIVDNQDQYVRITGREKRYKDFDYLVSFISSNKVSATKTSAFNKAAVVKFINEAGFPEACNSYSGKVEDIRSANETTISFGMAQLLRCAEVIAIENGKYVPGKNALEFLGLDLPQKAKMLYHAYQFKSLGIIDECSRISVAGPDFSSRYTLGIPRSAVVSMLCECPVNEWVAFDQLKLELFKLDKELFADKDGYPSYRVYNWTYDEPAAISKILMEYLCTLGAVDILAQRKRYFYSRDTVAYLTVFFKVTDLGAYLFGIDTEYKGSRGGEPSDTNAAKGFIIQPNFEVVVPNGPERMRHEFFFSRFATRVISDEEVSIFKIDFKGLVKALNLGISIGGISGYCQENASMPIPDLVKRAFLNWEVASKKIRIRTVTILEAEDVYLLEEVINYKGIKEMIEEIMPAFPIKGDDVGQVKKLIEKNNRFCSLE
ncbi:MAG: hypothetical protein FWG10_12870 [Eubacteriaceae bacterium]|nr:hypothetical protein [Eubacteriaceae bacterium]